MHPTPTFSVVIPLFNKRAFVAEALRSALDQRPPPLEVLVIDDGSTDGSAEVVEQLRLPNVRLHRQANGGVSAARNAGLENAIGDFVCFLDADDRYLPGFLNALAHLRAQCPRAALIATGYRRFSENRTEETRLHRSIATGAGYVDDFYGAWLVSPFFSTISLAIDRKVFSDGALRFPLGERLGEDQDLWFRIAERFEIAFDPRPFAEYRVGVAGSATNISTLPAPLPCYTRLAKRANGGLASARIQSSAKRLVATHWINIARSCFLNGEMPAGWRLLADKRSRARPFYLLRVALHGVLLSATGRLQ